MKEEIIAIMSNWMYDNDPDCRRWLGYTALRDALYLSGYDVDEKQLRGTMKELQAEGKVCHSICYSVGSGTARGSGWFIAEA